MATSAAQAFRPGDTREADGWVWQKQPDGRWNAIRPLTAASAPAQTMQIRPPDPSAPVELERQRVGLERDRVALQAAQAEAARGPAAAQMAVEERKAAAFLRRAIGADVSYRQTGVGPRSMVGQTMAETFPNVLNQLPAGVGNSPARQIADTNQDEFIAASLRQDSGAAIPPEELERQRRIYFPMPGEGPEVAAAKAEARRRAIQGLRDAAGRAMTPELQQILAQWEQAADAPPAGLGAELMGQAAETSQRAAAAVAATRPGGEPPAMAPPPEPGVGGVPLAHNLPEAPVVPPGGEEFQRALQAELDAGRLNSAQDIINFGRQHGFNIDPAQADAAIRGRESGQRASVRTPQYDINISDERGNVTGEGFDAFGRGAADVATLGFADELRAGAGALTGRGDYNALLANERAINAYDEQNHFLPRLGGQLATGAVLPMRGATLPAMMRESAAFGAAYGFGSGEGMNRFPNAILGAGIGALAPPVVRGALALPGAVGRVTSSAFGPRVTPEAQDIAQAAADEGITISRPIVDPTSRTRMARLEASVGGNAPVRSSLAATRQGIDERAGELASGGTASERGAMGQRIQAAADRANDAEGVRIGRIYDRAATAAGGATIEGREAVRVLDDHLARLRENESSNGPLINLLESYRRDFVDDAGNVIPKSIGAIRDLRTNLRGRINEANLGSTNIERMISDALDAAKSDITRDLGATAPDALRLYNQADRQWRARAETRRQIVERVIGPADNPISGAMVMDRVRAMASGDTPRLRRLWRLLNPSEQRDAAATIASAAGRKSPEDDFSPAQFMAWARTIEPSARQVIFGAEGARSIANLSRLSRELKATQGALNNARSGVVRNYAAFLSGLTSGGPAGAALGMLTGSGAVTTGVVGLGLSATTAGLTALSRRISSRALMSPDMSRWLAAGPHATSASAVREHINRLSAVAARDPAISQEVLGLRQALLQAVNDNFERRAAASEPDQEQNR